MTPFEIYFTVPGIAVPKARPRIVRRKIKGRDVPTAITPDKTVIYENLVKSRADNAMRESRLTISTLPLRAHIVIGVTIPASWNKKRQEGARTGAIAPTSRFDIDNVTKSILDAMNGVVFKDDGQVVSMDVRKEYAEAPRTIVYLSSTGQEAAK